MTDDLSGAIAAVKAYEYSFCKFISRNDAGSTGAHQAGIYIPKNSISLIFDEPGELGSNMEKFATLTWSDNSSSNCRFIYYGQGTRNEYRVTRLGKQLVEGDLFIMVRQDNDHYLGFMLHNDASKAAFLSEFSLSDEDTNKLIPKIPFDIVEINPVERVLDFGIQPKKFEINFKPKAHILVLLGEELIKSPVMAIYELIKNGYDADATNIKVIFNEIEKPELASILIEDDGTGMTAEVLENVWFEPGSDFRKPVDAQGNRQIRRSPVFKRIPMGEKGVGRFAVHKLGNRIHLVSRPAKVTLDRTGEVVSKELLDYEVSVEIDWTRFSQSRYLEDVQIIWNKNIDPATFHFPDNSGTFIQVDHLKEEWTRGMARQLKRQTLSMLSPKNDPSKFDINLDFRNWWLNNIPGTQELLALAPYKLNVLVDSHYNMTFDYKFSLHNNNIIGSRTIAPEAITEFDKKKYETNIKGRLMPFFRDAMEQREFEKPNIENIMREFDDSTLPYGNIMLEIYSYDLDSDSLRDTTSQPRIIKNFLRDHAGIKVFKGDLRVYDYGDPGNDWLNLDSKRVNNKAWFSNNQVIGFIYLDPESSVSLIEQTNREGFIHNPAYDNFLVVLEFILTQFMVERQSDRVVWLSHHQKANIRNSFVHQLTGFRELITTRVPDQESQQLLLAEAQRVEDKYIEDRDTLLIPAGVGLSASASMHEIEKLVPRMQESVREDTLNREKLIRQVEELKDYSDGLLSILRKSVLAAVPLHEAVQIAVNNYKSKLDSRRVSINTFEGDGTETLNCDRRLLVTMLMNIIDNSIYWLSTIFRQDKGIFISITRSEHAISIILADNGPGFDEDIQKLIQPYFTKKKNGIGIGLYLVDTIMLQYGRLNIITDRSYLDTKHIPADYNGAAVELLFTKNQS